MDTLDPLLPDDGVLRLRPLTVADAEARVAAEDDEMIRWLSGGRSTIESQRRYLAGARAAWLTGEACVTLALVHLASGALVGQVGLQSELPWLAAGQVNITYGIQPEWRQRGFASRGVELATTLARWRGRPEVFVIRTDPRNAASRAVALRCGFAYSHSDPGDSSTADPGEAPLDWYLRAADPLL